MVLTKLLLLPTVLVQLSFAALLVHEPQTPAIRESRFSTELWLEQPLDHFHPSNSERWNMRFYYSDEFAPSTTADYILILVGGEWSISASWLSYGMMYEIAQELGSAGMFYTEHRYYGQSRPTNDTSTENLRYLNVDQALGDLATFVTYIKSDQFENRKYINATVGLVGCSYAGSMVTWFRLAYPHLSSAGFSVSGPLHAQEDFPEYLETITSAMRTQGSQQCVDAIQESMEALVALLQTEDGPREVSQKFGTCNVLDVSKPLDLISFYWYGITETFAYLVQYATPGQIPNACSVLTNSALRDPVDRLASFIITYKYQSGCIKTEYDDIVSDHIDTSFDSYDAVMRLWTYQTCVEYGWYQTTTSDQQPFLATVPLEYFHQQCKDFFGEYYDEYTLRRGIERSNLFFAGLTHLPDRLVSVGGGDDPWHPMGPVVSPNQEQSPVYMVPATAHCRAMRSPADAESEEMAYTMNLTKVHMLSWLTNEDYKLQGFNSGSRVILNFSVMLAMFLLLFL